MDTFKEQLNYALRCEPTADLFYKKQFDALVKRYDWADEYGREMQRRDIDCTIYKDGGSPINLSEKFRDDDWGDMAIEIYSQYPNIQGWALTSQADLYAYHTPESLYMVPVPEVRNWLLDNHEALIAICDKVAVSSSNRIKSDINGVKMDFIKSYTRTANASWMGICVCIKWKDLEKFNINYKKYQK